MDGTRRYRFVWLEAPRKSGKTTLSAALMLYMLLIDAEPAAEICISASSVSNGRNSLSIVRSMIENDRDMSLVCTMGSRAICYKNNKIEVLSSGQHTAVGRDVSCAIIDDVQSHISRHAHDNLITSMAARTNPLVFYLSTAGSNCSSLAWELHSYSMRVADGAVNDSSWLAAIFGAKPWDDWTDPAVWRRSHPGINCTVSEAFLREESLRALQSPGFVDPFKRLYLNMWTTKSSKWLDMGSWDAGTIAFHSEDFAGRCCYIGLDLSTTTDLTGLVVIFFDDDGGYTLLPFAFCPGATACRRSTQENMDFAAWQREGFLTVTDGNVVDYRVIRSKILDLSNLYDVREVVYDRWGAAMLINQLVDDGLNCVPVNQDAASLNDPSVELEKAVMHNKLRHDGNPVLRWCAENACLEVNADGNMKPSKRRSAERIDLIVAALMGISRRATTG